MVPVEWNRDYLVHSWLNGSHENSTRVSDVSAKHFRSHNQDGDTCAAGEAEVDPGVAIQAIGNVHK